MQEDNSVIQDMSTLVIEQCVVSYQMSSFPWATAGLSKLSAWDTDDMEYLSVLNALSLVLKVYGLIEIPM